MNRQSLFALLLVLAALSFARPSVAQSIHQSAPTGYTPQRVYDAADKRFSDFEAMLADLARADVVFVGEQHDDPATHRLERALLEGLARRRGNIVLALEMFERDVQKSLDEYLAGRMSEDEFLKVSRPWPRYATDYRPLVEFARAHQWPVIAGNVPRRYASNVARNGLGTLDQLPAEERKLIAAQIQCPFDDYFKRFSEVMSGGGGHPGGGGPQKSAAEKRAELERVYFAQCIKDETMAESIANAANGQLDAQQAKRLVVHYNGSFHSDYRLGAAARAKQRLPKANVKVVTIVPLDDLDAIKPDDYRKRGDYLVFTLKPVKSEK